jgi:hypothetical protein
MAFKGLDLNKFNIHGIDAKRSNLPEGAPVNLKSPHALSATTVSRSQRPVTWMKDKDED